jgi:hypothetical protein
MGLYPYARLDRESMSRRPLSVRYELLTLENEYLRIQILPELGGRIWSAFDKLAAREIFYRTSVIKPTLYNQRGAWPAGNLEVYGPFDAHMLTWPGEAWPWAVERDQSGSATIVLSHIDHFFRNKVTMSVTLHPGRAYVELKVGLRNNNTLPNRYLLWTNAGIAATEGTRFVYPMTRTIAHDSSDLGSWPVSKGVDLSWYKNNENMLGVFGLVACTRAASRPGPGEQARLRGDNRPLIPTPTVRTSRFRAEGLCGMEITSLSSRERVMVGRSTGMARAGWVD